jgi:hypothetical protein
VKVVPVSNIFFAFLEEVSPENSFELSGERWSEGWEMTGIIDGIYHRTDEERVLTG